MDSSIEQNKKALLDVAPRRRQRGLMDSDSKTTVRNLDRLNLRLAGETFSAIDAACTARPGRVSRNTWIAEAVQEKLARETHVAAQSPERRARG